MPPYPFAPLPSFSEMKAKLEGYGCVFHCSGNVNSPEGDSYPLNYIERIVDEQSLTYVFVLDDEDEAKVTWYLIRSICARLKIDPKEFGLDLG